MQTTLDQKSPSPIVHPKDAGAGEPAPIEAPGGGAAEPAPIEADEEPPAADDEKTLIMGEGVDDDVANMDDVGESTSESDSDEKDSDEAGYGGPSDESVDETPDKRPVFEDNGTGEKGRKRSLPEEIATRLDKG